MEHELGQPGADPDVRTLRHTLSGVLDRLAVIPRRAQLRKSALYQEHRAAIEALTRGFAWRRRARPPGGRRFRVVAWNIERGKRLDGVLATLRDHPDLRGADLVLLNEVDLGMGRTGNRDVAAELADGLDMDFVYASHELLLSKGDHFERDHDEANTLALHGSAVLSRLPITRVASVDLGEQQDKFHAAEKRLGGKRALLVEVQLHDGPLTVALPHLDPFASPGFRGWQTRRMLDAARAWGNARLLVGGDLNTNTYDFSNGLALALNVVHKLARLGFAETVRHYLVPQRIWERPTFAALEAEGLSIDGFNGKDEGTTYYDLGEPEMADWTARTLPGPIRRYLERKLAAWGGCVPMRIDWFAGRGLTVRGTATVDRPRHGGTVVSDHNPIRVDLET